MTQNVINIANYHRTFSIFNVSVNKRPVNWITSERKKKIGMSICYKFYVTNFMKLSLAQC